MAYLTLLLSALITAPRKKKKKNLRPHTLYEIVWMVPNLCKNYFQSQILETCTLLQTKNCLNLNLTLVHSSSLMATPIKTIQIDRRLFQISKRCNKNVTFPHSLSSE